MKDFEESCADKYSISSTLWILCIFSNYSFKWALHFFFKNSSAIFFRNSSRNQLQIFKSCLSKCVYLCVLIFFFFYIFDRYHMFLNFSLFSMLVFFYHFPFCLLISTMCFLLLINLSKFINSFPPVFVFSFLPHTRAFITQINITFFFILRKS